MFSLTEYRTGGERLHRAERLRSGPGLRLLLIQANSSEAYMTQCRMLVDAVGHVKAVSG